MVAATKFNAMIAYGKRRTPLYLWAMKKLGSRVVARGRFGHDDDGCSSCNDVNC